ncbi:NAD(P)/FAD-dependent oxidoreductase [Roseovarius sp. CAU 1744]|uniref:flavin-containing monooxygenase n=1 Tax=Roseovarius sp. CAU 1744 TaxID=3140368 RepID=UPI00325B5820
MLDEAPTGNFGTVHKETDHDVVIIGSGFGGIAMAHYLDELGLSDFTLFEKADTVGGTWRENHYPGARCDVPAALYSLSYAPEWSWTSTYPLQPEILAYMQRTAEREGVTLRTHFLTEIEHAEFDQDRGTWTVRDKEGNSKTCRVLISAVGQLNRPSEPEIKGRDTFTGSVFHSAEWRHDVDLTGKTVAVVGTGASAIQIVPAIAPDVEKVVLLQRSPAWVFCKDERDIPVSERLTYRANPDLMQKQREELYEVFEENYDKYIAGTKLNIEFQEECYELIERQIPDPVLRKKVTPDYTPGCKRILASNEWYSTLARDNVAVVTAGLEAMDGDEIIDSDGGRHKVDVVVLATGFKATEFLQPMTVKGLDGVDLHEAWQGEPEAYRGVSIPGFPNFFVMYGPNTNTHNSIIGMLEAQARYIARKTRFVLDNPDQNLMVRRAALEGFYEEMTPKFDKFSWSGACQNWYRTESGRVINNWPDRTRAYFELMEANDDESYEIVPTLNASEPANCEPAE